VLRLFPVGNVTKVIRRTVAVHTESRIDNYANYLPALHDTSVFLCLIFGSRVSGKEENMFRNL